MTKWLAIPSEVMNILVLIERLESMKFCQESNCDTALFAFQATPICLSKEEQDIIIEALKKYAGI